MDDQLTEKLALAKQYGTYLGSNSITFLGVNKAIQVDNNTTFFEINGIVSMYLFGHPKVVKYYNSILTVDDVEIPLNATHIYCDGNTIEVEIKKSYLPKMSLVNVVVLGAITLSAIGWFIQRRR